MDIGDGKYGLLYARKFGPNDLIPAMWVDIPGYEKASDIYKECLERNITWRELTGFYGDLEEGVRL